MRLTNKELFEKLSAELYSHLSGRFGTQISVNLTIENTPDYVVQELNKSDDHHQSHRAYINNGAQITLVSIDEPLPF